MYEVASLDGVAINSPSRWIFWLTGASSDDHANLIAVGDSATTSNTSGIGVGVGVGVKVAVGVGVAVEVGVGVGVKVAVGVGVAVEVGVGVGVRVAIGVGVKVGVGVAVGVGVGVGVKVAAGVGVKVGVGVGVGVEVAVGVGVKVGVAGTGVAMDRAVVGTDSPSSPMPQAPNANRKTTGSVAAIAVLNNPGKRAIPAAIANSPLSLTSRP